MARFEIVPGESEVLVRARTNVNTVTMTTTEMVGSVDADTSSSGVFLGTPVPASRIEIPVAALRSGNRWYDYEGRRHFEAARYPMAVAELATAIPLGGGRHWVHWRLTFHGHTGDLHGELSAYAIDPHAIMIEGNHHFDVQHWGVHAGGLLGVRVHPDADFSVRLVARRPRHPTR